MPPHAQTNLKEKIRVLFGATRPIRLAARWVCVRGLIVYGLLIFLR